MCARAQHFISAGCFYVGYLGLAANMVDIVNALLFQGDSYRCPS